MKRTRILRRAPGDLFIRPVATPDGVSLGWTVCVLKQDDPTIQEGDMLILGHYTHFHEAEGAESGFRIYTAEQKKSIAKLAFPSEIWEGNALPQVGSDEIYWTILEGDELEAFRANRYSVICEQEDWHPSVSPLVIFHNYPERPNLPQTARRLHDRGEIRNSEP